VRREGGERRKANEEGGRERKRGGERERQRVMTRANVLPFPLRTHYYH
jgi:hypothetical protein